MSAYADPRLERFVALVRERTRQVNLTAARDEQALREHVDDSLAIARYVDGPYVDVGSGGGFPGVPVAIVTGARTTLIESVSKKARFLEEAVRELAPGAAVVAKRAEVAGREPEHRAAYASATARAVGSLTTVLELTIPLLATGGRAILQRGAPAAGEPQAFADALLVLGAELEEVVSGHDNRRVLLVRKTRQTSDRFPRRSGIPEKRPLCV